MGWFVLLVLAWQAATTSPSRDELVRTLAALKSKAAEIQTEIEKLEQRLAASPEPPPAPPAKPTRVRCAATTTRGSRCTRNAQSASRFCWQHRR